MGSGRRVAIALGCGGARGYAHIGVLEVLEERGYEVVAVAGSSMGAIVGGVFGAGRLADYREWVTGIGQYQMLRLLDLDLSSPGALRGDKIFGKVGALVGELRIEDLPVLFTAVATDLLSRKEVWFQRGSLELALRASGAIPSLFPPVEWNGRLLADGGLLNPLPLAPMAAADADVVIAVSLHGEGDAAPGQPAGAADEPEVPLIDRIRAKASRVLEWDIRASVRRAESEEEAAQVAPPEPTPPPVPLPDLTERAPRGRGRRQGPGKFDVVNLSFETMQAALTQHKLAGYRPDLLVSIPRNACRALDFHRAVELIALGRRLASEALDRFEERVPPPAGRRSTA